MSQKKDKMETLPVGNEIMVQMKSHDEIIMGEIYAYEPSQNLIVLYLSGKQHKSSTNMSFRILNTKQIVKILKIREKKDNFAPFSNKRKIPDVNMKFLKVRLERAIQKRTQDLGVGVSLKGQFIFNELSKLYEGCKWEGETIALYEFKIKPPYEVENVEGPKEKNVKRIKRMVTNALAKITNLENY